MKSVSGNRGVSLAKRINTEFKSMYREQNQPQFSDVTSVP